jgi:hypothetical protein
MLPETIRIPPAPDASAIALPARPSCAEYQSAQVSGTRDQEQKSRIAKFTLDIDKIIHNYRVVDNLGTIFAALTDPTRRAMIERLSHGPASVHGLTETVCTFAADDFKTHCLPGAGADCNQDKAWTRECVHA